MLRNAIALIVILFLGLSYSHGQSMTGMDLKDHMLIKLAKDSDHGVNDFEGSPLLSEQFVGGQVFSSGKKFTDVSLRYNIFNDQMEFRQKEVTYALYPEPRISKIILGAETYVVEKYEIKGKMAYGYLARIDSGKLTVFSKKVVRFTEAQEAKALESSGKPAKFTRAADVYYYKIGNGEVSKLGSLKNLIESLPDKQKEVAGYAKDERLSVKSETELKKLATYYNSL
jgi:hypothetical protein